MAVGVAFTLRVETILPRARRVLVQVEQDFVKAGQVADSRSPCANLSQAVSARIPTAIQVVLVAVPRQISRLIATFGAAPVHFCSKNIIFCLD